MIVRVSSSLATFKTVEFQTGFNAVFAERTNESTRRDSRNGLGKSLLVEIIHFCLGANLAASSPLRRDPVSGASFTTTFSINGYEVEVTRSVSNPSEVHLQGELTQLDLNEPGTLLSEQRTVRIREWTTALGKLNFGLSDELTDGRYGPTYRVLVRYFMRGGLHAFNDPFQAFRGQRVWQKQVNLAFLLGLDWRLMIEWQELKDRESAIKTLQKVAEEGDFEYLQGDVGELEASRSLVAQRRDNLRAQLESFRVHPEYLSIEDEANGLTRQINAVSNDLVIEKRLLQAYRDSIDGEVEPEADSVAAVYAEVESALPDATLRQLSEVETFHRDLIANRRRFLESELIALRQSILDKEEQLAALDEQRARRLTILASHGALSSYYELQEELLRQHGSKV